MIKKTTTTIVGLWEDHITWRVTIHVADLDDIVSEVWHGDNDAFFKHRDLGDVLTKEWICALRTSMHVFFFFWYLSSLFLVHLMLLLILVGVRLKS